MEGIVEGNACAFAIKTREETTSRRREVGDGESDAVTFGMLGETFIAFGDVGGLGGFAYLPMSTRA